MEASTAAPDTLEETDVLTGSDTDLENELGIVFSTENPYSVIVFDDPVNTMVYVEYVFRSHFKHSKEKAHKLMMTVHTEGKAAVWSGDKEKAEQHVTTMHQYGLQATFEQVG